MLCKTAQGFARPPKRRTISDTVVPYMPVAQTSEITKATARGEDVAGREAKALLERFVESSRESKRFGSSSQSTKPPAGRLTFVSAGKLASIVRVMRARFRRCFGRAVEVSLLE
jgi:hypothetical protein